jgi:hypothetical protein
MKVRLEVLGEIEQRCKLIVREKIVGRPTIEVLLEVFEKCLRMEF